MSKVTRSKLKFLIYILLQETNKLNRKFFQILNDFLEPLFCKQGFFLLILFQDFLHNLLRHKPILHFRFSLAILCIRAFLSFRKHRILCVQFTDTWELFVKTIPSSPDRISGIEKARKKYILGLF